MAAVPVSLAPLQDHARSYETMYQEMAAAARELAGAVDAVDEAKVANAQSRMEQAVQQEAPLVEAVNRYCQTP